MYKFIGMALATIGLLVLHTVSFADVGCEDGGCPTANPDLCINSACWIDAETGQASTCTYLCEGCAVILDLEFGDHSMDCPDEGDPRPGGPPIIQV